MYAFPFNLWALNGPLLRFVYNRQIVCFNTFCCLVDRIRIVFKWLMRSFSGHLPPEQLLMLWDLVLAYDSLEIQPLLAVAILSFRRENLLQVNTQQSTEVRQLNTSCILNTSSPVIRSIADLVFPVLVFCDFGRADDNRNI